MEVNRRLAALGVGANCGLQFGLDPSQPEQAHVRRYVNEQVRVTAGLVLTAAARGQQEALTHWPKQPPGFAGRR